MRNLTPEKKLLLFLALVVLCSTIARALKARESALSVQAGALDLESFAQQTDSAVKQGRRKPAGKPKVSRRAQPRPVSIRHTTEEELERLPGMTPTTAARIVAARDASGGRLSIEDIAAIPGIGRRKAEAIRPYLLDLSVPRPLIGYDPDDEAPDRTKRGAREPRSHPTRPAGPVDVNRATQEELESLPGVGPGLAERILAERKKRGRFADMAALDSVPGIGPALLRRLEGLVRF